MLSEFEINRIYMEYQPKIEKYLLYKTNNRDLAEDLCSDVFMKLLKKADTFDETKASVSTWIYTIARNTLYDYFRTRHVTEELDEEIREDSDVEESICNDETMQELADALKNLTEKATEKTTEESTEAPEAEGPQQIEDDNTAAGPGAVISEGAPSE